MKNVLVIVLVCVGFVGLAQEIDKSVIKVLALGDSYTIGQGVPEEDSWPFQLRDSLLLRAIQVSEMDVIATTGWRTDNLKLAIGSASLDSNYDLVGLLIGVNNQYQGTELSAYYEEFPDLLNTAIALAAGDTNHVFVFSIPDYAYTPFGNGSITISQGIDVYNAINDSITNSKNVTYYNITPISRGGLNNPALVAGDNLHPSGKQYGLWVNHLMSGLRIAPVPLNTTEPIIQKQIERRNDTYSFLDNRVFDVMTPIGKRIKTGVTEININAINKEPVVIFSSATGSIKVVIRY